ncbi:UNVERIFIED_CONTAM: hypothetical protein Scaly_2639300 [Sesamum calycinum]|uniref:DNA-directed RNA polymerase n=1 Tax=Sesamum calycinum TaxID=2727403 RepID=A0AAW2JC35_9LAMI
MEGQIDEIRSTLKAYARAPGQVVNFSKSSLMVSGAIWDEHKRGLAARLGVRLVTFHDHYLGLLALVGRSRSALFHNIRDHFWGRINGWNGEKRTHWVARQKLRCLLSEGGLGFRDLKAFNLTRFTMESGLEG